MATYKVVGPRAVHGTKPGETFTADLPEDQEAVLVAGGHIQRASKPTPKGDKPSEGDD